MLQKRKTNHQTFELDCYVDENRLKEVVRKFSDSFFYIEITALNKKDRLMECFTESDIRFASITNVDDVDVILMVGKNTFNQMVELFIQCDAELVVFYFPNNAISFEQFLYSKPSANNPQREAIKKNLCSVICTWVTNEDKLHFDFNPSKYTVEFFSHFL